MVCHGLGSIERVLASFWFSEEAGFYIYGVYLAGAGIFCGAGFALMTIHVQFKRSVALDSETAGQPVAGTDPERPDRPRSRWKRRRPIKCRR